MPGQCFLRFFALLLAIVAAFTIALWFGAPQAVWRADASMMTSAVAALFVVTVAKLGHASWRASPLPLIPSWSRDGRGAGGEGGVIGTVEFGHLAVRLSVMFGFVGTAVGLSLQAHALASEGAASLNALSTSLFTTATGGAAAALIEMLTFNLEMAVGSRQSAVGDDCPAITAPSPLAPLPDGRGERRHPDCRLPTADCPPDA